MEQNNVQLFENQPIRTAWDEENEEWYFSIVDVVGVLTEQPDTDGARNYWKVTKNRLKKEGSQLVTNCNQLKILSQDGKRRNTDVGMGNIRYKNQTGTSRFSPGISVINTFSPSESCFESLYIWTFVNGHLN